MEDAAGSVAAPSLDSLAPQSPSPAPAPAVAPSPSATPAAAPAAAPAAPAAPAFDHGAFLARYGYKTEDDFARDLAFTRRFRAEAERVEHERLQRDPQRQQAAQRGEALRALVAEGYSPEVADALPTLPELSQFLNEQRAEGASRDLDGALREIGLTFTDAKDSQDLRQAWEDAVADKLNSRRDLNARYFGTPAERKAVIREIVEGEERRINAILVQQNAQTLRDYAARRAAPTRTGTPLPTVRQEKLTATDPLARRREGNAAAGRQLDDIWAHYGS